MAPNIATRCPSCGFASLFIGAGGHLTCSRLICPAPSVDQAVEARDRAIAHYKAALVRIAKGDEEIRGLAPKYYGHAMTIALNALGLGNRLWAEEVDAALLSQERSSGWHAGVALRK